MTTTTTTTPHLTAMGRKLMTAIGENGQGAPTLSFFDGGIVEDSGSWMSVLSAELSGEGSVAKTATGVANVLKKLDADGFVAIDSPDENGEQWVRLTKLGADTANQLVQPTPTDEQRAAALAAETVVIEKATKRRGAAKTGNPKTDEKVNAAKAAKSAKSSAKPTAKTDEPDKSKLPALPEGYVVRYPHKSYDLCSTLKGQGKIKWGTRCNAHGTFTEAEGGRDGDTKGTAAVRPTWCKGCAKDAK